MPWSSELFATITVNSPSGTTQDCEGTSQIEMSYCDSLNWTMLLPPAGRLSLSKG